MEQLFEQVVAGLSKIGLALKHKAWKECGPGGLTPTQAQALALVRAHEEGGIRLTQLARELAVSQPTATDVVAALARKRLVRKVRAPDDGRSVLIRLTPAGKAAAGAVASWPDFLVPALRALSEEERRVFLRALVKMVRELQERGEISVARMCATCVYFRPYVYRDPLRPHHCDFVNAAFGDGELRIDCPDHVQASQEDREAKWAAFARSEKRREP